MEVSLQHFEYEYEKYMCYKDTSNGNQHFLLHPTPQPPKIQGHISSIMITIIIIHQIPPNPKPKPLSSSFMDNTSLHIDFILYNMKSMALRYHYEKSLSNACGAIHTKRVMKVLKHLQRILFCKDVFGAQFAQAPISYRYIQK